MADEQYLNISPGSLDFPSFESALKTGSGKVAPPLVTPSNWVWTGHAIKRLERARWPHVVGSDLEAKLKAPPPDHRLTYVVERLLRGLASKSVRAVRHDLSMPAGQDVSILPDSNHWLRADGLEELLNGGFREPGLLGRCYHLLLLERHVDEIELELAHEADEERALRERPERCELPITAAPPIEPTSSLSLTEADICGGDEQAATLSTDGETPSDLDTPARQSKKRCASEPEVRAYIEDLAKGPRIGRDKAHAAFQKSTGKSVSRDLVWRRIWDSVVPEDWKSRGNPTISGSRGKSNRGKMSRD